MDHSEAVGSILSKIDHAATVNGATDERGLSDILLGMAYQSMLVRRETEIADAKKAAKPKNSSAPN